MLAAGAPRAGLGVHICCVPGHMVAMGWMEVAVCLIHRGEDSPMVQVAQGMAGASRRQGDGE